jgi:hypothetical protein
LSNGQALPGWLHFNAVTDSFSGTAPITAQILSIAVTATDTGGRSVTDTFSATVVGAPVVTAQTATQTFTQGSTVSFALPSDTFTDPQGESLTYKATLANGQALPGWLSFNAATQTFSGTAPNAVENLGIKVTATDTSGLSASDSFAVDVTQSLKLAEPTPNQTWDDGQEVNFVLPAGTFTDAPGERMSFIAYQTSGPSVTSWLRFNPTADEFVGMVPANVHGTVGLAVVATDSLHMTVADLFDVTFAAGTTHIAAASAPAAASASVPTPVASTMASWLQLHS